MNKIFKAYCENTTLHGWAYIPAVSRLIYRLFWAAVICGMFIGCFFIVDDANTSWIKSPTISTVKSFAKEARKVQFPTITICPVDQELDKWGFMAAVLNTFAFVCDDDESCAKTGKIKGKFAKFLASLGATVSNEFEEKFIGENLISVGQGQFDAMRDALTDLMAAGGPNKNLTYWENALSDYFQGDARKNKILREKFDYYSNPDNLIRDPSALTADANLTKLFNDTFECGTKIFFENKSIMSCGDNRMVYVIYKCLASIGLPPIGPLGTLMSNFAYLATDTTLDHERYANDLSQFADAKTWMDVMGPDRIHAFAPVETEVYESLMDIQTQLFEEVLPIHPLEIAAVMKPSFDFMKEESWSKAFPYTLKKLVDEKEAFVVENVTINNFFGAELTPYRNKVIKALLLSGQVTFGVDKRTPIEVVESLFPNFRTLFQDYALEEFGPPHYKNITENRFYSDPRDDKKTVALRDNLEPLYRIIRYPDGVMSGASMVTDGGVCTVYNVDAGNNFFLEADDTPELLKILNNVTSYSDDKTRVQNIVGSGQAKSLMIQLQLPLSFHLGRQNTGHYKVSFNDRHGYVSNQFSGQDAFVGYQSVFMVKPTEYSATDNFKDLSIKQRKCRFSHEHPDPENSLFKYYSQSTCSFECKLRQAYEFTKCTPWFYWAEDWQELCDGQKTMDFVAEFSFAPSDSCDCLEDCESVSYNIEQSNYWLEPKEQCKRKPLGYFGKFEPYFDVNNRIRQTLGFDVFWYFNQMEAGTPLPLKEYLLTPDLVVPSAYERRCDEQLRHEFGVVSVIIDNPYITEINSDQRVSFADKLGIAGGTVGLFSGLSLISVVELGYWIMRWIMQTGKDMAAKKKNPPAVANAWEKK